MGWAARANPKSAAKRAGLVTPVPKDALLAWVEQQRQTAARLGLTDDEFLAMTPQELTQRRKSYDENITT
jgi:hypothetical protein